MALCALTATACGGGGGPVPAVTNVDRPAPAVTAKVSLLIEVTPQPGAKAERWTLRCQPTGGTHPDAAAACHQLLATSRPFAPLRSDIMCPMIRTGEQTATVKGTWFGARVDETFSQVSGCAAMRWKELGPVFSPIH
jgi:Subtilisin inhibitor-like